MEKIPFPSAHITKNKQRLKQFVQNVYLKNGDEFEIELFNPKSEKILAVIEINGKRTSNSGLVIRPGERVYLERYLNNNKKFLFETYLVDENDEFVQRAIKNNGSVKVKFYDKLIPNPYYSNNVITYSSNTYPFTNYLGTFNVDNIPFTTVNSTAGSFAINSSNTTTNSLSETGRIGVGSNSNQSFVTDYDSYETDPFYYVSWKILPESKKEVTQEDIKVYCTECGSKRKKDNHKFCPHCGTKY